MTVTKWLPGLLAVAGIITWSGAGMADRGGKGDDNANVHTDKQPGGEIRGQIRNGD